MPPREEKKVAEFAIISDHCNNITQLLTLLSQLAQQDRNFAVTSDDHGWSVSYSSGPVTK